MASGWACRDGGHHRAGVDLALGRPLLRHPGHVGSARREQRLEHRHGRLAVFVVRRDRGPGLGGELRRLVGQHGGLHIVRRPQAERVAVAGRPHERVRQRFAGQVEDLVLLGEVGQRQPDVGEEAASQHRHMVARHELVRGRQRLGGLAGVVLGDHGERLAVDAARDVDLVDRHLPALAVGLGEGGQGRIGVDLADADHGLLGAGRPGREGGAEQGGADQAPPPDEVLAHVGAPRAAVPGGVGSLSPIAGRSATRLGAPLSRRAGRRRPACAPAPRRRSACRRSRGRRS